MSERKYGLLHPKPAKSVADLVLRPGSFIGNAQRVIRIEEKLNGEYALEDLIGMYLVTGLVEATRLALYLYVPYKMLSV